MVVGLREMIWAGVLVAACGHCCGRALGPWGWAAAEGPPQPPQGGGEGRPAGAEGGGIVGGIGSPLLRSLFAPSPLSAEGGSWANG